MRRRAFTLVEIMIVALIIGILVTIAIPQFLRSRAASRQRACIANLRSIENSKEQLIMELRLAPGTNVVMADLVPAYIRTTPTCPAGGSYTVNAAGADPTCSFVGDAAYPHRLR